MADNPAVEKGSFSPSPSEPEAADEVDGKRIEELSQWVKNVMEELVNIFTNVKAETAAAVLSIVAKYSGEEAPGAFTDLQIRSGPKKDDKIAIIGAGPAGIHMAYQLKKADYQKVVVLERSDRVGGKSYSREHRFGVRHEMGSCYMSPDYRDVRELLDAIMPNSAGRDGSSSARQSSEERVIGRRIFDPESERGEGMEFEHWLHSEVKRELNEDVGNFRIAFRLMKDSVKYIRLHRRLFGRYQQESFLMARPADNIMSKELNCTVREFLEKHELFALVPIFKLAFTLQGYGYLDKTPAIYGLMWVTPHLIVGLVEQMKVRRHLHGIHTQPHQEEDVSRSITVLRNGFQSLWTEVVRQESIDVRLNCQITEIERRQEGVLIRCNDSATGKPLDDSYDFLIIAAPIRNLMRPTPILDTSSEEERIFSKLRAGTFVTTLVDYVAPANDDDHAVHSWFDNLRSDKPFAVWSVRDMLQLLRENHGSEHELTRGLPHPGVGSSLVAYQFADVEKENANVDEIEAVLKAQLDKHQLKDVNVIEQCLWSYFPHFSQEAIRDDGVPWKILDMQGKNRTWYVGSSTCFESLNSIISYNKSLLKTWESQRNDIEPAPENEDTEAALICTDQ